MVCSTFICFSNLFPKNSKIAFVLFAPIASAGSTNTLRKTKLSFLEASIFRTPPPCLTKLANLRLANSINSGNSLVNLTKSKSCATSKTICP